MAEDTRQQTAQTVKKAVGIIMVATLISRLLGWVKLTTMSSIYGRTLETDAFFAAFAIPDLLYLLVSGGAMTAAFIPTFTGFIAKGQDKEGWRVASTIWNQIAIFLIVFILIGVLFADKIVLLLPGFHNNPQALAYGTTFVRLLYPMVFFTALAALCNGVLQSFNHFTAPAASWLIYNVFFILAAYLFRNSLRLSGVCLGVLGGALAMVLVQLPVMAKKGMKYSLSLDWKHPEVVNYWKLFLPVMLGMSLTQVNLMIIPTIFGSMVGKGAITSLNYANRMMFIPLGMFGSAISMAIFPTMSRMAAEGDLKGADEVLSRGIRATFVFSLPCTAFLMTAGLVSIRLVFGHGKFDYEDCYATSYALMFFAVGLMGHSANQAINRGFYARKDSMTPVLTGLVGLTITVPLALLLIRTPLKHGGIALAISIATLCDMSLLLFLANRKLGLDLKKLGSMFARTFIAAAAMGAAGWAVGHSFNLNENRFGLLLAIEAFFAISAISLLVFAAFAKLLKIKEFDEIVDMFLKRLRGRCSRKAT